MKTALIIGCDGQDGRIAFDLLVKKGHKVLGLGRNAVRSSQVDWKTTVDLASQEGIFKLIENIRPEEIYYLAAYHHASEDKPPDDAALLSQSHEINVQGLVYFLEAVKKYAPKARLFYAASSLIYGGTSTERQDETTPFCPDTIYGMTKLNGLLLCRYYREKYGVFASSGILYNHESYFRKSNFISKKIINAVANIAQGKQGQLVVGDLEAQVDWGYAPDYVQAMHLILNADTADEFIIATGQKHTVEDFVRIAFACMGLDWKKYVKEDSTAVLRKRKTLVGNAQKLRDRTGWQPTVDFKDMIKLLLEAQLGRSL